MMPVVVDHEDAVLLLTSNRRWMPPKSSSACVAMRKGISMSSATASAASALSAWWRPRHPQPDLAEPPLPAPGVEDGLEAVDVEVARLPVRVGRRPQVTKRFRTWGSNARTFTLSMQRTARP
jgi:hypothetical protein